MFRPAGLVTWLVLCLLAGRVVAVPTPRAPGAVSFLPRHYLLSFPERLGDLLGWLR